MDLARGAVADGVMAILQDVIRKLGDLPDDLRKKDAILPELTGRLRRLQGPVYVLSSGVGNGSGSSEHPAYEWLQDLEKQLQRLDSLLTQSSGGIVEWSGTSDELAEVDKKISQLLQEEPLVYDAESSWRLSKALTTGRPELRQKTISETYSQFRDMTGSDGVFSNDGSSSSAPAVSTSEIQLRRGISMLQDAFAEPEIRSGRADLVQELIANLVKDNKRSKWYGLWAMGGAGKTFIAKEVFRDKKIARHFTGGKLWLTVSKQSEDRVVFLLRELWIRMHHKNSGEKFPEKLENAKAKVKELLNKDKVLLVLDDVWDRKMLGHLDVVSESSGSVILVTTRDEGIFRSNENSSSVADAAEIEHVRPLSEADSLNLFSWHAFGQRQFSPAEELETVARDIVSECKGLPLALKVIGSAMGDTVLSRTEKMQGRRVPEKWEEQLARMRRADSAGDPYDALYASLQVSVDHLAEEDVRLRDCFFYFAAYPEDEEVFVEELVGLWVAEGVVENNALIPGETKARAFLALLVAKSMIELAGGYACKVHDVMRDLAFRNLRGLVGSGQTSEVFQWECMYEPDWKVTEFPSQWTQSKTALNVRRLSLVGGDMRRLPDSFSAGQLQVLLLRGNRNLKALPVGFFRSLSLLRVLDLSFSGIVELSGEVVRNLKSLVLLDVTYCKNLRKISRQLETLQNLETIRSQYCHETFCFPVLKTLPKLTTLKTDVGQNTSSGGLLTGATRRHAAPVDLLVAHTNLIELSVRDGTFKVTGSPSVSSLTALETLWLNFLPLPQGILQLHRLRELYIHGHRGELPALDTLPDLHDLTIDRPMPTHKGNRLPESFGKKGAFPGLRRVQLFEIDLENFVFHSGSLPVLERLNLVTAKIVPSSLSELHSLRSLRIFSRVHAGNLGDLFSNPDYFPHLTTLELLAKLSSPPQVKSLPALSRLVWPIPKAEWPAEVAQLEKSGKLEVQLVKGF